MATTKASGIKLSRFTVEYILDRRQRLIDATGARNENYDRYQDYYDLKAWESDDDTENNWERITLPTPRDVVDKRTALMFSRRPSIDAPPQSNSVDDMEQAELLERVCYAITDRLNLFSAFNKAEKDANLLGRGTIKVWYKGDVPDDDFFIAQIVPDPRTVYGTMSGDDSHYTELVHTWYRTRREIESELNIELNMGDTPLEKEEEWLDEQVCYTEYWKLETGTEDPKTEEKEEEPKGSVELAAEHYLKATADALYGPMPPAAAPGESIGDYLATADIAIEPVMKGKKSSRRVQKVVSAIVVGTGDDADFIKKPVVLAGYCHIPYFSWGDESLLYGILGGDADNAKGVYQASNLLVSLYMDEAIRTIHPPIKTNDPTAVIDTSADAVIRLKPGAEAGYMAAPSVSSSIMQAYELMRGATQEVTLHEVLSGRVFNLSGQAISGMSSAFERQIALAQHSREVALKRLYEHSLYLLKSYADPLDGVEIYGEQAQGKYVNEHIMPDDIPHKPRITVKMSSSMPRDEIAWIQMFSNLARSNQISMETFLGQLQKVTGMGADTPADEMERILRDRWIMDSKFSEKIAEQLGTEIADMLTGKRGGVPISEVQRQRALNTPRPPAQPSGPGPQQGEDPSLANMPITPDMVAAAGNMQGANNLQQGAPLQ